MLPTLSLGPASLPTYPLAVLLAIWLGLEAAARAGRPRGLSYDAITNALIYGLIAGVIVARASHVLQYWPAYRTQPLEIFGFNLAAFILWPGASAAVAVVIGYAWRRRLGLWALLDAVAVGALLALVVINIGALLGGRNLGAPTTMPWAVSIWGVARHPVQLYEAVAALGVMGLVWRTVTRPVRPGVAGLLAVLGYGLSLWLLAPFRAAETSAVLPGGFRLAQVAGLTIGLLALLALRWRSQDSRVEPRAE